LRDRGGNGESTKHGLPYAGVLAGAIVDVAAGFYSGVEIDAMAYFQLSAPRNLVLMVPDWRIMVETAPEVRVETSRPFAVRLDLVLIGKRW
jgi:hypothetical protein